MADPDADRDQHHANSRIVAYDSAGARYFGRAFAGTASVQREWRWLSATRSPARRALLVTRILYKASSICTRSSSPVPPEHVQRLVVPVEGRPVPVSAFPTTRSATATSSAEQGEGPTRSRDGALDAEASATRVRPDHRSRCAAAWAGRPVTMEQALVAALVAPGRRRRPASRTSTAATASDVPVQVDDPDRRPMTRSKIFPAERCSRALTMSSANRSSASSHSRGRSRPLDVAGGVVSTDLPGRRPCVSVAPR